MEQHTIQADRIRALMTPIRPDSPAGDDLSFSPLLDDIREARRSDDPALTQGDWEQALKSADWRKAARLCEEGLMRQGKDLQLVVWYAEAQIHLAGFPGATQGLRLLDAWMRDFWDTGFPELDAADLDERIAKIEWLSKQMGETLRTVPLTDPRHGGHDWNRWKESRDVENIGLKDSEAKARAIDEGKLSGEAFDKSVVLSGADWFRQTYAQLEETRQAFQAVDDILPERFGDDAPSLADVAQALQGCSEVVERLLQQQFGQSVAPVPPVEEAPVAHRSVAMQVGSTIKSFLSSVASPAAPAAPTPAVVSVMPASAALQNRADAVRMLEEAARYFRTYEPHSPVGLLAERAASWAGMRFEEWLAHVIKDDSTLRQLNELLGVKPAN
jgi:type VI secretion system protein ImpA